MKGHGEIGGVRTEMMKRERENEREADSDSREMRHSRTANTRSFTIPWAGV